LKETTVTAWIAAAVTALKATAVTAWIAAGVTFRQQLQKHLGKLLHGQLGKQLK
jgi:hypothetical protein